MADRIESSTSSSWDQIRSVAVLILDIQGTTPARRTGERAVRKSGGEEHSYMKGKEKGKEKELRKVGKMHDRS